ncbi:hypothetical protein BGW38_007270 [Lunasporangiospora selenospora]|uniref:chitin synthase n=1 Tax=Lunasporangiospora selenospora TaxID=979761 RepID=A0A9P6FZR5_9FUNG|nr:hypothetical protein BGW38_007270 [Lunasporangiospora selenospora]
MSGCGFKPRQTQHIWRLLGAILHIGNVQFTDPINAGKQGSLQEAVIIKNPEVLDFIADILGVPSVVLNAQGAAAHRDSLARALYTALFGYLVEQINRTLCHSDPANFIAILDQPGLSETANSSSLHLASFEHFALNFANEMLHGFLGRRVLDDNVGFNQVQVKDGIKLPGPMQRVNTNATSNSSYAGSNALFDNSCLQLLVGKGYKDDQPQSSISGAGNASGTKPMPYSARIQQQNTGGSGSGTASSLGLGGLVRVMDDSSAAYSQGTATDADCLHKATLQFRGDSQSQSVFTTNRASSNYFAIQHFTGKVEYSVDDFLDKNLDQISPDFIVLLRNSANKFIVDLFTTESAGGVSLERHPKFEKTIVKAQLQTRPRRQPSRHGVHPGASLTTRRSLYGMKTSDQTPSQDVLGAMMRAREQEEDCPSVSTVLSQVYVTVLELIQTMDETMLWNLICLRPNDTQSNFTLDTKKLRAQVNAYLLPDFAHRKRIEFTMAYPFEEFLKRYEKTTILASLNLEKSTKTERGQCLEVTNIQGRGWNSSDGEGDTMKIALGNTCVWMAEDVWKEFEDDLRSVEKDERLRQKREMAEAVAAAEEAAARARARALEAAEGGLGSGGSEGDLALSEDFSKYGSTERLLTLTMGRTADDMASEADALEDDIFSDSGEKDDDMMSDYGLATLTTKPTLKRGITKGGNDTGKGVSESVGDANLDSSNEKRKGKIGNSGGKGPGPLSEKKKQAEPVEVLPTTRARKLWVFFTWCTTWWIPSFMLSSCGKMKRDDIRMAWREKVALCCIIFFMSAIIIFVITGFGKLMCPGAEHLFSSKEVGYHAAPDDFYVSLRGKVYDITKFAKSDHSNGHASYPSDTAYMLPFAGTDVTEYFPLQMNIACYGLVSSASFGLAQNTTVIGAQVHGPPTSDTTIGWAPQNNQGQWYWKAALPRLLPMKKGDLAFEMADIQADSNRKWFVLEEGVYDLTSYYNTVKAPGNSGPQGAGIASVHFLEKSVEDMAFIHNGEDVTSIWKKLPLDPQKRLLTRSCLDQAFYVGKFLAALQLGSVRVPEEHDKFVIIQIPCYTEDEDSLRKTIDSITALRYDDKRKLLFIIADGMIIGSGNELPTPRIVLNLLGADPSLDPEPLAFKSIGDGSKQLNMGKIYSGLYEYEGHVVPYIVVAKVGKPSERSRPGNRGKRDSQVILMKFLNKVHFDAPMCPLELEIYHQMKNVIGVDPSYYEYILQVDADTEVMPDALNRLVSCMIHDGKIIGLCGETQLGNEENSWTTMIQVYEYYISHHLAKAFESLFGSVTCLPGCFCMYRVRTPVKNIPLIISSKVIEDYSDNQVDTLHKKNLLSLGEDRYLTTLMMKHFPQYKMTFTPDATCRTVAPDRWSVLLSQRRRWINSTIHNLAELMFLPEMCGFCCFSMRFVVFLDLFGTLTLPASVVYLIYLIVIVATGMETLPQISLILLGAVYGLQALIFIIKRQWQHIGWMFIYILAIPLFSFFIPVYSFWHFDDFSWGNTRMVVGEGANTKKVVILGDDEEPFDEKMIPMKKWSVYEQEMWEIDSINSHESKGTEASFHTRISESAGAGGGLVLGGGPMLGISASPRSAIGGGAHASSSALSLPHYPNLSTSQEDLVGGPEYYHREPTLLQQHQQQRYHRNQASKSSFGLEEDLRRASISSMPRSIISVSRGARGTASPGMGVGPQSVYSHHPYGHHYQDSTTELDPQQAAMQYMQQPRALNMGMGNGSVVGLTGGGGSVIGYGDTTASIRGGGLGGGSQRGAGSVVGAPYDVGFQSHHVRQASSASAGLGPGMGMVGANMGGGADQPTDEQIANEIQNVLATADLMSITKKQVRERLIAFFGVDLTQRKEYINGVIERLLENTSA